MIKQQSSQVVKPPRVKSELPIPPKPKAPQLSPYQKILKKCALEASNYNRNTFVMVRQLNREHFQRQSAEQAQSDRAPIEGMYSQRKKNAQFLTTNYQLGHNGGQQGFAFYNQLNQISRQLSIHQQRMDQLPTNPSALHSTMREINAQKQEMAK